MNKCTIDHAIIADGCIVTEACLKRCVIGVRSILRQNTRLENTIMMGSDIFESEEEIEMNREAGVPDIGIGENSIVRTSIIDKNARIGKNVVLDPAGKPEDFESKGIFIRDGVLMVPKNAVIPDNTVI